MELALEVAVERPGVADDAAGLDDELAAVGPRPAPARDDAARGEGDVGQPVIVEDGDGVGVERGEGDDEAVALDGGASPTLARPVGRDDADGAGHPVHGEGDRDVGAADGLTVAGLAVDDVEQERSWVVAAPEGEAEVGGRGVQRLEAEEAGLEVELAVALVEDGLARDLGEGAVATGVLAEGAVDGEREEAASRVDLGAADPYPEPAIRRRDLEPREAAEAPVVEVDDGHPPPGERPAAADGRCPGLDLAVGKVDAAILDAPVAPDAEHLEVDVACEAGGASSASFFASPERLS